MKDTWIFDQQDLGVKLAALRKESGHSITRLCELAGITRESWYRMERGDDVNVSTLMAVLNVLNLYPVLRQASMPELEEAREFFKVQKRR